MRFFAKLLYKFGTDKCHGVLLLPEGLIESIPEVYALLQVVHVVTIYCSLTCTHNSVDPVDSSILLFFPLFYLCEWGICMYGNFF